MSEQEKVFDGILRTQKTYLGGKYEKFERDSNGIILDTPENAELKKRFSLTIEFDFTGLTVEEVVNQMVSTTSYSKMLQNNELKNWTAEQAETNCKTVYKCKVRSLLDNRQSKTSTPEQKRLKAVKTLMDSGLSKADILAMIESA